MTTETLEQLRAAMIHYCDALAYGKTQDTRYMCVGTEEDRADAMTRYKRYLKDGLLVTHTGAILPAGTTEIIEWEADVNRNADGKVNLDCPDIFDHRGWYRGTFVETVRHPDGTSTRTPGRKSYRKELWS
jgi:hypothetical protein